MLWWPYSTDALQLCFKYQWNPLARATPDEPEILIGPPAGEACSTNEGADDSMDVELFDFAHESAKDAALAPPSTRSMSACAALTCAWSHGGAARIAPTCAAPMFQAASETSARLSNRILIQYNLPPFLGGGGGGDCTVDNTVTLTAACTSAARPRLTAIYS